MAKIYTKCDEIPLCKFIEVYNGNLEALVVSGKVSNDELRDTASYLMQEYASIIGNNNLSFEIGKKNSIINSNIKLTLLDAAANLINMGSYKNASDILEYVGIKMADDHSKETIDKTLDAITSNRSYIEMRLTLERNKERQKQNLPVKPIDFTRERMIVGTHFKMYIDPLKYTAAEYGNMVKMMLDELKEVKSYGKRN
jgi:hypothetical protein